MTRSILSLAVLLVLVMPISCTQPAEQEPPPETRAAVVALAAAPTITPSPTSCVRTHPAVMLQPSIAETVPGGTVQFTVTVKNNDDPPTCGPVTYTPSLGGSRLQDGSIGPYLTLADGYANLVLAPGATETYSASVKAVRITADRTEIPMEIGDRWTVTLTWRTPGCNNVSGCAGTGWAMITVVQPATAPTVTPMPMWTPVPSPSSGLVDWTIPAAVREHLCRELGCGVP